MILYSWLVTLRQLFYSITSFLILDVNFVVSPRRLNCLCLWLWVDELDGCSLIYSLHSFREHSCLFLTSRHHPVLVKSHLLCWTFPCFPPVILCHLCLIINILLFGVSLFCFLQSVQTQMTSSSLQWIRTSQAVTCNLPEHKENLVSHKDRN